MITLSTDNRRANHMSDYHLVFFKIDGGSPIRYTELTPEQQIAANNVYPVTFEARQNFHERKQKVATRLSTGQPV